MSNRSSEPDLDGVIRDVPYLGVQTFLPLQSHRSILLPHHFLKHLMATSRSGDLTGTVDTNIDIPQNTHTKLDEDIQVMSGMSFDFIAPQLLFFGGKCKC